MYKAFAITFVTGGEPFHGASPEQGALGGSESALVQVARALAGRGHRVTVYCHCPAPGEYHGVIYRDHSELRDRVLQERPEVLVVSRFFTAFDLPWQAGLNVLWNHDILDHPSLLASRLEHIDLALVLSRFHARDYQQKLPALAPKLVRTRNGLDLELLARARAQAVPQQGLVVYASRPERGLEQLLEHIWPRLRRKLPHLRLAICGYQVDRQGLDPATLENYRKIDELVERSSGVELMGPLAKLDYYRLLAGAQAVLYPCVFPEISCLVALEAQALDVPVITSDRFALRESVVTEAFRVAGDPGSTAYLEAFVQTALHWLGPARQQARLLAARAGEKVRRRHDWRRIAAEWEALFGQHLEARRRQAGGALAASLVLNGDRLAAGELLQRRLPILRDASLPVGPDEPRLLERIAAMLKPVLEQTPDGKPPRLGVLSCDQGRTAGRLAQYLEGVAMQELEDQGVPQPLCRALLIRDRLERSPRPAEFLCRALGHCQEDGWVLLCVACGAWPLITHGYAGRLFDLGQEDLRRLLPGRSLRLEFLPRGLVRVKPVAYAAGYWLALAPVSGPAPLEPEMARRANRVRPAPAEVAQEVRRAGLL